MLVDLAVYIMQTAIPVRVLPLPLDHPGLPDLELLVDLVLVEAEFFQPLLGVGLVALGL